ncbi:hypothetical protein ACQJBY_049945 [Aegilops geniculata]
MELQPDHRGQEGAPNKPFLQELKGTSAEDLRGEGLELYLMPTWPYLGWLPAALRLRIWSASPSLRRPVVLLGHRRTAPHQQTPVLLHQNQFPSC